MDGRRDGRRMHGGDHYWRESRKACGSETDGSVTPVEKAKVIRIYTHQPASSVGCTEVEGEDC